MSDPKDPERKPPPQPPVTRKPEDVQRDRGDEAARPAEPSPSPPPRPPVTQNPEGGPGTGGEDVARSAGQPPTPPLQPTVQWNPEDIPDKRQEEPARPTPQPPKATTQPTVAWNPEDVPGIGGQAGGGATPQPPTPPSQPTIAWDPGDASPGDPGTAPQTPVSDAEDPLVGTLLRNKWRVLKRLGAGSFGTVYKVQDVKGGWIEALKILGVDRLTGADAENMRKRFLREAQIMKRLGNESRHIVGLGTYEEDIEAGLIYFLMEFVEGRSLADVLNEEGPMSVERVIELGLQVCHALVAAHKGPEAVVHRDLKLENLMLTVDGSGEESVKVLDFGIAKIAEREADSRLTTVGTLGTPGYAAPEQLRAEEVDGRTDLFAFGVILYALLTGRDPWLGLPAHEPTNQIYELMAATDRGQVRPIAESGVDVPPAMASVVMRLLRRDPAQRYQSAAALRDALQRVAAGGTDTEAGSLRVLTDTPGVRVEIRSGREVLAKGPTPCVANAVSAGTYRVTLVDPRFEPLETTITLGAGAMEDLTLAPKPRKKGVGAAALRRPGLIFSGLVIIALLAGAYVMQPWGRTVEADELRELIARGAVTSTWLVDGGLDGLLAYGPLSAPFHLPVDEGAIPSTVADLRNSGINVDTYFEVQRLTGLAQTAQGRSRYYGLEGGDVLSYAQRLATLDPNSGDARSLLLKVGERMAWDAEEALIEGSVDLAGELVATCLELVPEHPRCLAVPDSP